MPDSSPARPWPDDWDTVLDTAIHAWGGEWGVNRVQHLYAARYSQGLYRPHARDCLSQRAHAGLLILDDRDPNRRVYTLRKDHSS